MRNVMYRLMYQCWSPCVIWLWSPIVHLVSAQPAKSGRSVPYKSKKYKSPLTVGNPPRSSADENVASPPSASDTTRLSEDSDSETEEIVHYLNEAARRNEKLGSCPDITDSNQNKPSRFLFYDDMNEPSTSGQLLPVAIQVQDENGNDGSRERAYSEGAESIADFPCSPSPQIEQLLGKIMLTAQYSPDKHRLELTLREGFNIVVLTGDPSQAKSFCRIQLMPEGKPKFKSQIASGSNPEFMETFILHNIKQEHLSRQSIRIRMYRRFEQKHDQLLSECSLALSLIDARNGTATNHLLTLNSVEKKPSSIHLDSKVQLSRHGSTTSNTGSYCTTPVG